MAKYRFPVNWPSDLKIKRQSNAGEYRVFTHAGDVVADVYRSSRGWAYAGAGAGRMVIGADGQGYSGYPVMEDALFKIAQAWTLACVRGKGRE